eukprot:PhF_6_TR41631/c0_g1_i1/m.63095
MHPANKFSHIWNNTPGWCRLCREPFTTWPSHDLGVRVHACMEMAYEMTVRQPGIRSWATLGHTPFKEVSQVHSLFHKLDYCLSARIHDVLKELHALKLIGHKQRNESTLYLYGTMNFRYRVCRATYLTFQGCDSGQLTAYHQIVVNARNIEVMYDWLQLDKIFGPSENSQYSTSRDSTVRKGMIFRCLFGELMKVRTNPRRFVEEQTLCQFAIEALPIQAILCNMAEYVTRQDPVWRDEGCPVNHTPFVPPNHFQNVFHPPKS